MGHLKLNLNPSHYMEEKKEFSLVQITEMWEDVTNLQGPDFSDGLGHFGKFHARGQAI